MKYWNIESLNDRFEKVANKKITFRINEEYQALSIGTVNIQNQF